MAAMMNAATFMGNNFLDNRQSIKNSSELTLKKMFDISEKLVSEQEEINTKVYVFSDSMLCLGKIHQIPESNESWKNRREGITTSQKLQRL